MQMEIKTTIGLVWIFENAIVYGSVTDVLTILRSKVHRRKFGNFIGIVKGLIPQHSIFVLFEYLHHDKRYIERQKIRAFKKRIKISQFEQRRQRKLTAFL